MSNQNHCAGGSYVIDADGKRVLIERTKEHHEIDQSEHTANVTSLSVTAVSDVQEAAQITSQKQAQRDVASREKK